MEFTIVSRNVNGGQWESVANSDIDSYRPRQKLKNARQD